MKFQYHSKRSVMRPCDMKLALSTLNVDPLYGYEKSTGNTYTRVEDPADMGACYAMPLMP